MKTKNKCLQLVSLTLALLVPTITAQANPNWVDIWRDDFNRAAGDVVGNGWVEAESSPSNASLVSLSPDGESVLQLYNNGTTAMQMVSTVGYTYVTLEYKFKGSPVSCPNDQMMIDMTFNGGGSWSQMAINGVGFPPERLTTWTVKTTTTPGADDNAGFGFRLRARLDSDSGCPWPVPPLSSRGALVDYVVVTGVPSSDMTAPVVSNVNVDDIVFGADATVTATATDAGSNIKSAEYALDDGAWTAMSATDGAFDSKSENLTATLSGLNVKTYEVCVQATDVANNKSDGTACGRFDVKPAQLGIVFAGQELDLDGAPTQLKAEVTGPCSSGAEVEFFADLGSGYVSKGTASTNTSGVAALNVALPVGVHDIKVEVDDQDLDGDSVPECLGHSATGITVVADPNASSTGGGWYKIDGLSPPRVNFGYTAQRKYNKKLDEYSTSGNLLWMHQDSYRLKGAIDSGGMLPEEMCDPEFAACAAFAGEGTLYEHNPAYDPACLSTEYCGLEWINPSPNTPFVIFVNDGGTSRECVSKKKCKDVEKPDQFGIEIELESIPAESDPVYLNGGNLVVR